MTPQKKLSNIELLSKIRFFPDHLHWLIQGMDPKTVSNTKHMLSVCQLVYA